MATDVQNDRKTAGLIPSYLQSHIFLVFLALPVLSDTLFDTMVSFAAFYITGWYKVLSIVPSISAIAYFAFGLIVLCAVYSLVARP